MPLSVLTADKSSIEYTLISCASCFASRLFLAFFLRIVIIPAAAAPIAAKAVHTAQIGFIYVFFT
ncbi:MAG TPA: hypothetical protein DDX91_08470 [Ruminococcaceae bacterium]|nr:hypothetical protein [Oscillospiraceae bacterium]